ncbi:LuxR C-terminal-related transcriptional regulator [Streptomyces sp. NPDC058092]|uniref:response regulator transcription factor n=1 Tax=Streptomyces sp. NPDC058092 TaxID=3346336 RepID=UPI0036E745E7
MTSDDIPSDRAGGAVADITAGSMTTDSVTTHSVADSVIEASGVRRRYAGGFEAVAGVSFSVARGELADGVSVATSLRAELPGCRTMTVTSHGRPGHLKRARAAGVRAFVPKTVSARQLAGIIRTVHAGNRYVDPELAADAISAGDSPLTAREAEVLEPAADGAPVAEIAERASLSQGTVRNYLSAAASKLGAENRHAAVRLARERGWV